MGKAEKEEHFLFKIERYLQEEGKEYREEAFQFTIHNS